jgi:uncharacterized membrane protein
MKANYLIRGLPGHPLHPPLTDATIGAYTVATLLGVLSALGVSETNTAHAWWLALVISLALTVPTALAGLADWLGISWGTPMWRTATTHLLAMVSATVVFAITAAVGYSGYEDGAVRTGPLVLTLVGFGLLTLGGWLGGTIVYVHGMRVLNLAEEPAHRATAPVAHPEKERAEGMRKAS